MNSRTREYIIKISLTLAGVLFALILLEIAVRVVAPTPGKVQFVPDAVTGFRHAPNQRVHVSDGNGLQRDVPPFKALFETNQYGDPDIDRPVEKPEGVFRIAVIGDSMVEAAQVPREERFTTLLEAQLNDLMIEEGGKFRQVEVLNFGTAGFGTAQELLYYRHHVRTFDPDLVLLVFLAGNDIKNNSYELEVVRSCRPEMAPFLTLNSEGELALLNENFYNLARARYEGVDDTTSEKIKDTLREKVRLVDLAYRAYGALRSRAGGSEASGGSAASTDNAVPAGRGQLSLPDQDLCQTKATLELFEPELQQSTRWKEAWQLTEAILRQFAEEVEADGARFHLISATGPWEVQAETRDLVLAEEEQDQYDWDLPHQMVEELAARLDIRHYTLFPALEKAVREDGVQVHYLYNGHYTPAGHRLVAEELIPVLRAYLQTKPQSNLDE